MADEASARPPRKPPLVRGKDYRLVYSNGFRLRVSLNDATIMYAVVTDRPSPDGWSEPVVSEESGVILNWVTAKLLSLELNAMMEEFEAIHGKMGAEEGHAQKVAEVKNMMRQLFGATKPPEAKTAEAKEPKAD